MRWRRLAQQGGPYLRRSQLLGAHECGDTGVLLRAVGEQTAAEVHVKVCLAASRNSLRTEVRRDLGDLGTVAKFNADTDLRHAFRKGIEETWAQGDRQLEEAMSRGRELMIDATIEKLRLYGCAGKAGGPA